MSQEIMSQPIFPRTIGDKTFYSKDEMDLYLADITEQRRVLKAYISGKEPAEKGRKPGNRSQFSNYLASYLNDNRDSLMNGILVKNPYFTLDGDMTYTIQYRDGVFVAPKYGRKKSENPESQPRVRKVRKVSAESVDVNNLDTNS